MIDTGRYASIIRQMENLASRAGDMDNVEYFGNLVGLLESDSDRAIDELVSNMFWGGSGSFFDQGFYVRNKIKGVDYNAINLDFRKLLLELLLLLRSDGHTHPWFDSREAALKKSIT